MTRRYFGTDGIRGRVGDYPVSADFMLKLGWAAGRVLAQGERRAVVIGKDTRVSGYLFESALEAGLASAGAEIRLLGPMPTPAVAYLTRTLKAAAGIVISASHNAFEDNGIKFFSGRGEKLPDDLEAAIEEALEAPFSTVDPENLGKAERIDDAAGRYIEFCKNAFPGEATLHGLKLVVDCAHGATYHVAPRVLSELGAEVVSMGVEPDGFNINRDRGSTSPAAMSRKVVKSGADAGIAFDGDGDRVIMADATGQVVDGDELLYIIARARHRTGRLRGGVVGTLMSNAGLALALERDGIEFRRARVGDRFVHQMLVEHGWELGGESSGHILCRDLTSTGDGIISALQVLAEMKETGRPLRELADGMEKLPHRMINVPVAGDRDLDARPDVRRAVARAEEDLGPGGRVILRPSGTEPVVRVTVEGRDAELVESVARSLAQVVTDAAGGNVTGRGTTPTGI